MNVVYYVEKIDDINCIHPVAEQSTWGTKSPPSFDKWMDHLIANKISITKSGWYITWSTINGTPKLGVLYEVVDTPTGLKVHRTRPGQTTTINPSSSLLTTWPPKQ